MHAIYTLLALGTSIAHGCMVGCYQPLIFLMSLLTGGKVDGLSHISNMNVLITV